MWQTYANLCLLGAGSAYCFTDAKGIGKGAKFLSIALLIAFVITEGAALLT